MDCARLHAGPVASILMYTTSLQQTDFIPRFKKKKNVTVLIGHFSPTLRIKDLVLLYGTEGRDRQKMHADKKWSPLPIMVMNTK